MDLRLGWGTGVARAPVVFEILEKLPPCDVGRCLRLVLTTFLSCTCSYFFCRGVGRRLQALRLKPNYPKVLLRKARLHKRLSQWELAIKVRVARTTQMMGVPRCTFLLNRRIGRICLTISVPFFFFLSSEMPDKPMAVTVVWGGRSIARIGDLAADVKPLRI